MSDSPHVLHRDLDCFLRNLSDTLNQSRAKEKETDIKKLTEFMDDPPGAPIKGHTPSQWFPYLYATESASLMKEARKCDAEMYVIEKIHESRVRSIEKTFQSFQERVREHGVKAIETVSSETVLSKNQVEEKRAQLKKELQSLTHQRPDPVTTTAYGVLLAKFQQTQQWQQTQEQQTTIHAQASQAANLRTPSFTENTVRPANPRDDQMTAPHFAASHGSAEFMPRAPYGATNPRPPAIPMEQWLLTMNTSGNSAMSSFHKSAEMNTAPDRRNLMAKQQHTVPRVMQYTVSPHPFNLNKPARNSFQNVKLPLPGCHRQPSEDNPPPQQHPFGFQPNLSQNQHSAYMSNVLAMQQPVAQCMPIQLQSPPGVLSNVIPTLASLCMLQRVPHPAPPPPPMQTQGMQQRIDSGEMSSTNIASHMHTGQSMTWNAAPRPQVPMEENAHLNPGRPKMFPRTPHPVIDGLPKTAERSLATTSAFGEHGESMLEERRAGVLERSSSIPGGKATITTGIGRPGTVQPDFLKATGIAPTPGPPELPRLSSVRSLPDTDLQALSATHLALRSSGGSLDEKMLQSLQQQMSGFHTSQQTHLPPLPSHRTETTKISDVSSTSVQITTDSDVSKADRLMTERSETAKMSGWAMAIGDEMTPTADVSEGMANMQVPTTTVMHEMDSGTVIHAQPLTHLPAEKQPTGTEEKNPNS